MPRHARKKRSRSPPLRAHGSDAPDVAELVSHHARRAGEHSQDDDVMTVDDDELRLMRHRLASAEAELAELRAKSNAIDTLLGEGFLETKEVVTVLAAHVEVDHANYAESSRAAVASRALRRHVLKAFSDAASANHTGLHEIDSDTFVRCQIPHSVVPRLVSEHVIAPYLERDILVILKPLKTPGLSSFYVSSSSDDDEPSAPRVSVLGSTVPVGLVLDQLKRVPKDLIKTLLSPSREAVLRPMVFLDAAARLKTLARFKRFLCGLCRRATLEELQCLGEWFTSVDPDKELLGSRTWCAVRCGNALPDTTGDFDVVDALGEVGDTLLFTDVGRDQVFIPFAKNATRQRAATLLDILLSILYEIPRSRIRDAAAVFLTASMRDDFFLPIVRAHPDNRTVAVLPSILNILFSEATEGEAALFLTPSFRDEVIVTLADSIGTEAGAFVCALTRAAPDAARVALCTADFRDDFFVEMMANEANEVEWLLEALLHLVTPPSGGWRDTIDPDPVSVFATEEFSKAFIVPAISRLKELDDDERTVASSNISLLLGRLSEVAGIDTMLKPWKERMLEDAEFRADGMKFIQCTVAALAKAQRALREMNAAQTKPWYE